MLSAAPSSIRGRAAARLIGFGYPGPFNAARKTLERVLNRENGRVEPYPDFGAGYDARFAFGAEYDPQRHKHLSCKQAEALFRATAILVVPEWGGLRIPGTEWSYDAHLCATFRARCSMAPETERLG